MWKATVIFKTYVYDFYFAIHDLSWWQRLICSPWLLAIEYMVYRVDAVAEGARAIDIIATRGKDYETLRVHKNKFIKLIKRLGLFDEAIARAIDDGEDYVRLENRLTSSKLADHRDVMRLAELRAADVRLLHRLLFRLLRRPYDEPLLSALWPVEVLADIGNDFNHYSEDVSHDNYNTYDMFVRLHGTGAAARMSDEIDGYERMFLQRLGELPEARRARLLALCSKFYRRHLAMIPDPQIAPRASRAL
jgi:hypothetical protein